MTKTKINTTQINNNTKKIINWPEYNRGLVNRGRICIWIDKIILESQLGNSHADPTRLLGGRPKRYSDNLILSALTIKELFGLTLRATEGLLQDLLVCICGGINLSVTAPDYTTLCRRSANLNVPLRRYSTLSKSGAIDLLIDSTGVKIMGEGEWKIRMHGKSKMKRYRKVHIAIDYSSRTILGVTMSDANFQDADAVPDLLREISQLPNSESKSITTLIADGAYDRRKLYQLTNKSNIKLIAPPITNARIRKTSDDLKNRRTYRSYEGCIEDCNDPVWGLRNKYVMDCRRLGKAKWKEGVGYHKRSLIENTMYRLKRSFTDEMRAKKDNTQLATMKIRLSLLNYFTSLGLPEYKFT